MRARNRAVAGLLTSLLLVSSCSPEGSTPTGPGLSSVRTQRSVIGGLLVVERTTPLASDITWSFTAGPLGATSSNAEAGLTVTIPAGALATTETITVTALAGSAAAYRFEPHLEFAKKVRLAQDASQLNIAALLPMWGGHFDGDTPDIIDGVLSVTEISPAVLSILTGTVRFDVSHFSGWILASGNGTPPDSTGGGSGQ